MIRQPSTRAALYAWHTAALTGGYAPHWDGEPQCGWYRAKLSRESRWVPVRIWCHQDIDPMTGELTADERLRAEVNGLEQSPEDIWSWLKPISQRGYDALKRFATGEGQERRHYLRARLVEGGPWVVVCVSSRVAIDPVTGLEMDRVDNPVTIDGTPEDPAPHLISPKAITEAEAEALIEVKRNDYRLFEARKPIDLTLSAQRPSA